MNKGKIIFVSGTGTGIGKTIVSAILMEAWGAAYWKPVQAGIDGPTDTEILRSLIGNPACRIFPETHLLENPVSPHLAAQMENKRISLDDFKIPETSSYLIIEGAGGLFSPLNDSQLNIDLIQKMGAEVVVVVKHYLGSINHSLLSIEALKNRGIPMLGIVFNGVNDPSSEYVLNYTGVKNLLQIKEHEEINKQLIREYALQFLENTGNRLHEY